MVVKHGPRYPFLPRLRGGENMNKHNKFKSGSGCFKCIECGKLTRNTGQDSNELCQPCEERLQHENSHADNDFKNDICEDGKDCAVLHYTKEQRWWLE